MYEMWADTSLANK
jgi:hypothetical protein